ncbi:MAG: hypothetical protein EWV63_00545 [Microcystis aeruginosa Ma_OC_H_19870700_S124]|uniref:Uncharacterized protein n=1 Tax=Microcystis aeruginosa Ma_OC_H_19870700_S124 TaxID=2486262 RepID=A0A552AYU9_MICAE|nr:MAG: hypothetical protein EWV63_00545 [Microcystis aeruginosa Ma_OC_H_19870700_S124]
MIIIWISELSVIFWLFIQEAGVSSQESVVRRQEIIFIYSPHTPHPTPHTPLPHFPTSPMIAKKLHQEGNNFQ